MSESQVLQPRIWPGVLIVVLMWLLITIPGWLSPGSMTQFLAIFWGPMLALLAGGVWFVFFSRLPWREALVFPMVFVALMAASVALSHPTFRGFGHLIHILPWTLTAAVAWLVLATPLSWPAQRNGLLLVSLIGWSTGTLIRLDGITGSFESELSPRWTATAEDIYQREKQQPEERVLAVLPSELGVSDYPGFRGARRDSIVHNTHLATDWESSPPELLWKQRIGPGWGSFAVIGDYIFTQEQRDEQEEAVVCMEANTGKICWVHADPERFTEPVAGPGPRATPTYHNGKLYTLTARGTLNCLNASTGKHIWKAYIQDDSGAKIPEWGFAASPLVAHGLVTIYAGGKDGKAVLAYDALTGKLQWTAGTGLHGYASTQLFTLAGKETLAVTSGYGLTLLEPKTGKTMLEYEWKMDEGMARCCQPAQASPDELIFGTGFAQGTRKLKLTPTEDGFSAEELWTSTKLNPYYNDHVIHDGYIYGIDGILLTCLDLQTGETKWRQRGYDAGQVLLLADQGLLLVVSEKGKVALLRTNPQKHERLGQFEAFTGKTWNHPALAGDRLFVRNGEWAACFRLPQAK
jgi:outer membrane protein assembly factor BamB